MSRFDQLADEIRRSPSFLPPCPLDSFLNGIHPAHIAGPDMRRTLRTIYDAKGARTRAMRYTLSPCCSLADGCPWFEQEHEVAAWWREKRQQPLDEIALNNRRRLTLERLAPKYDPLPPLPAQPPGAAQKWDEQAMERKLLL